jgi:hypothetical protein
MTDPTLDTDEDYAKRTDLIHYVMDLENLVRWLALTFSYEDQDTGEVVVNDPIWSAFNQYGQPLPDAQRLQATWDKVMHD